MSAILAVDKLVKRFPVQAEGGAWWRPRRAVSQVHAVDEVSFALESGETLGLVGESGCGKSTLVRLVARLIDPTSGSIRFDGSDLGAAPARGFGRSPQRAHIQMVFQDPTDSLNPRFTASEAIADPLRRLKRMHGKTLDERVREAARLCGLPVELLGRFPHQLSGGQKARVGIARAIAVEPRLLILDEPTSALDVSVQVVILRLLDDLKRRLGLSYLFVSHDLNIVRLLCDRVLVMYSGKIVESGPTDAVFNNPAHPYTAALISAIPSLAAEARRQRIMLPGEPRSPIDPDPRTCRFHGRCPKGVDRCREAMPILLPVGEDHTVACHFPEGRNSGAPMRAAAAPVFHPSGDDHG
jgi:oligopeptide/dipeptide ABC transporter ATP-binding protein